MIAGARPFVLIVDPDRAHTAHLARLLIRNGFETECASGIGFARSLLGYRIPDLAVLELNLPDGNGRGLFADLSSLRPAVACLVLTSVQQSTQRIRALEEGADDFLTKPFDDAELIARINALLRRHASIRQDPLVLEPNLSLGIRGQATMRPGLARLQWGKFSLDLKRRELIPGASARNDPIALSTKSFSILRLLAAHPHQIFTRERIARACLSRPHLHGSRSIDVEISRLRKLIEPNPKAPVYLRSAWGQGYLFTPEGGSASPPPGQQFPLPGL